MLNVSQMDPEGDYKLHLTPNFARLRKAERSQSRNLPFVLRKTVRWHKDEWSNSYEII
jgi:hypothetical protein